MSNGSVGAAGIRRLTAVATASETMRGLDVPNRSDMRPASGDSPDSIRAAHRNVAAITVPDAPRWASRRGASTSITPKARPASAISHMPMAS